jgi:hypothetical protein
MNLRTNTERSIYRKAHDAVLKATTPEVAMASAPGLQKLRAEMAKLKQQIAKEKDAHSKDVMEQDWWSLDNLLDLAMRGDKERFLHSGSRLDTAVRDYIPKELWRWAGGKTFQAGKPKVAMASADWQSAKSQVPMLTKQVLDGMNKLTVFYQKAKDEFANTQQLSRDFSKAMAQLAGAEKRNDAAMQEEAEMDLSMIVEAIQDAARWFNQIKLP